MNPVRITEDLRIIVRCSLCARSQDWLVMSNLAPQKYACLTHEGVARRHSAMATIEALAEDLVQGASDEMGAALAMAILKESQ